MNKFVYWLEKISQITITACVFLVPIAFNPLTANLFDLNKFLVLALATAVLLFVWALQNLVYKTLHITLTPFTLPLLLFALISTISTFWGGGVVPGLNGLVTVTILYILLALLFVLSTSLSFRPRMGEWVIWAIIAGGLFLSLSAILETVGIGPSKWITILVPSISDSNIFISLTGSAVSLVTFLVIALILSLYLAIEKKSTLEKSGFFGVAAVITAAVVVSAFNVFGGKASATAVLPFGISWQIAVENIKSPQRFLLGVGPQNYIGAFSAFKPVEFNTSPNWNTRFGTASDVWLHIFTTTGLIGFAAWILIGVNIFRTVKQFNHLSSVAKASLVSLCVLMAIGLLTPPTTVSMSLFVFLLMALGIELKIMRHPTTSELSLNLFAAKLTPSDHFHQPNSQKTSILPIIIAIPSGVLALLLLFASYRVYAADMTFRNSLVAAASNDGTKTYNMQRDAIALNPFLSSYHRTYANTNISIATSLSQRKNLSDQDKQTISTLIKQAVREARSGVILDPANPAAWETLANVYRNLINVADGAKDTAITAYAGAIQHDPRNPRLRVELGGIYYQLQQFPNAIRLFEQAVGLKQDYANAHYNLAVALAKDNQLKRAIDEYEVVISILDPTSADYNKALEEQNQLKTQLGDDSKSIKKEAKSSQIESPKPLPSPVPQDQQVKLSDEDKPPQPTDTLGNPVDNLTSTSSARPAP